ncbi:hypothetical protein, unknown function [Leishmania tarentolae]|uniref:Uncharacterized protein n=1 Tax=Leishmania tarentolae TaxID=5689 RepID=A0A640KPM0_LEITA|nr:hypothetical protein, unknown function [Leishmania tarentolae]
MSDRYGSMETSFQFSSSSSFRSVLPPIDQEGCTHLRVCVVAQGSSGKMRSEEGSGVRTCRLQHVKPFSLVHNEEEEEEAYARSQLPIHRTASMPPSRAASSNCVRDSARATVDSEYYFPSTVRGSTSPPGMSTYFSGAGASAAPVVRMANAAMSLMSEREPSEAMRKPDSTVVCEPEVEHVSGSISPSPPAVLSHSCAIRNHGCVPPAEVVVVNVEEAQAAHALLTSFSAAVIARYRLLKFKVVQRIYRVYYDKWRWRVSHSSPMVALLHVSAATQTSAPCHRSFSAGTEFADIDSFHATRSLSRAGGSPGGDAAVHDVQPCRFSPATPTPSRHLGEGESERGTSVTCSPAPAFLLETFASASPPSASPPSVYQIPTATISAVAPPTNGIGARTKPAKLLDFGRHSERPQRKSLHLFSIPEVNLPAVVPSPERIFRY